jgi:acyl-coenzyme A thioesterase PaaI-like protein
VFQYSARVTSEQRAESDPHDRLGEALRTLADVVVRTGADAADVAAAAEMVEVLTQRLAVAAPHARVHDSPYHPMSLVGGTAHPLAPQLHTAPTGDGVAGMVALGPTFEGGPGLVHGGIVSLLFDHAMGQALFVAGHSAMTVSLEVTYRAPTPLGRPLAVSAQVTGREGRKLFVGAQLTVDGTVSAEGRGVFVQLTADNVARLFPAHRIPDGPPPSA